MATKSENKKSGRKPRQIGHARHLANARKHLGHDNGQASDPQPQPADANLQFWHDDRQICRAVVEKRYAEPGNVGAEIRIETL